MVGLDVGLMGFGSGLVGLGGGLVDLREGGLGGGWFKWVRDIVIRRICIFPYFILVMPPTFLIVVHTYQLPLEQSPTIRLLRRRLYNFRFVYSSK